jgi:hypothetical protein
VKVMVEEEYDFRMTGVVVLLFSPSSTHTNTHTHTLTLLHSLYFFLFLYRAIDASCVLDDAVVSICANFLADLEKFTFLETFFAHGLINDATAHCRSLGRRRWAQIHNYVRECLNLVGQKSHVFNCKYVFYLHSPALVTSTNF